MFPTVPVKTSTPEVQKVGVGLQIKWRIEKLTPSIPIKTGNRYRALQVQEVDSYGDYQQPWKLDSGASGHYCGPRTGVKNKKKQAMASK